MGNKNSGRRKVIAGRGVNIQFWVDPRQKAAIHKFAREQKTTVSGILRRYIGELVSECTAQLEPSESPR